MNEHLKFSLCLDPVFTDYDYYDRVKIAAELGYDGIELWDVTSLDPTRLRQVCDDCRIEVANFNCIDAWNQNMCRPSGGVLKNMQKTFQIGRELNARNILVLSSYREGRMGNYKNIMISNLKLIGELAAREEIHVNLEPLNILVEHRGYALDSSEDGFEIIKCVDNPWIGLVFDIYHMQIMEGNIISNLTGNIDLVGHIHTAGCPGRHEHFLGENDYPNILTAIAHTAYDGYIGLEYFPSYDSRQSVKDVLAYLKSYTEYALRFPSACLTNRAKTDS